MSKPPYCCAALLVVLALPPAFATEGSVPSSTTLPGSPRLAAAVAAAPALAAARGRAEAARARQDASARFPDPEVEGMISRRNTPEDTMPMWELSLRQPLPKAGERSADRDRAQAMVAMADAEFLLMVGEMAADVAMALAEAETAQRRAETLTTQITRTEHVLSSVTARIATGQSRLTDRLALQTRIAAMQLMVAREKRMAEDAWSQARGRLGLHPDAALPSFEVPSREDIHSDQSVELLIAGAKEEEAVAMSRMARATAKPMTSVGLRFERERDRMGNNDTLGIAFMTELPWRGRRYARAEERAARVEATAALAEANAARFRIQAALSRVERAEGLAELARRIAEETQARLEADYEALVRAVGAGSMGAEPSLLMLLDVLEKTTDAELQAIDAEGTVRTARAELWRYVPPHFLPQP